MDYKDDYDENGNKIIRTRRTTRIDTDGDGRYRDVNNNSTKAGWGIGVAVAIILFALAAWFLLGKNHHTSGVTHGAKNEISKVYDETKDVVKEVPQAVKDATKKGDQDTTRPNKDKSTDKLDQK